jgi:Ni/Co efflux regulator RcnB
MKTIVLIAAAALALPMAAMAQTTGKAAAPAAAASSAKPPLKERAKTKAKTVARKVVPKHILKKVEEAQPISDDTNVTLTPEDLAVAQRVLTGSIKCELGASVNIEADGKKPGFFNLTLANQHFRMHPVESRTGAIRLEDPRAGAMWLQLGNKSMLMSQKQGTRLADDCQAAKQVEVEEEMKKHPPKSLFEGADATPAGK